MNEWVRYPREGNERQKKETQEEQEALASGGGGAQLLVLRQVGRGEPGHSGGPGGQLRFLLIRLHGGRCRCAGQLRQVILLQRQQLLEAIEAA